MCTPAVHVDDHLLVKVFKANGTCYRWWQTIVETVAPDKFSTISPLNGEVHDIRGGWKRQYVVRTFYWLQKPYNLLEIFRPNGELREIYIHIASPIVCNGHNIQFIDFELDVVRPPHETATIIDEDEFLEAAENFGYTAEFQNTCYMIANEAVHLANSWIPGKTPRTLWLND